MIDQLEAELRQVFALRATSVSAEAVDRLRRVDYRPRTKRRWPLTIGGFGAASGAAAMVLVVVLGGSPAPFTGWSATPTILTAAQSVATQDTCAGYLSTLASDQSSWSQVATDVRGPYTMAVYDDGIRLASCFISPSFTTVQTESLTATPGGMAISASGNANPPSATSSPEQLLSGPDIEQLLVSHLSEAQDGVYTLAEGRLDSAVSAVTLVLSNGHDVTATTGNGWLVAWWPGNQGVTAAQVASAGGTTSGPLNEVPNPTPPSPPSNGPPRSGTAVRMSNAGGG